jgi:tetrahydromethanopterin S-methyltransferase subunit E
MKIFIYTLIGLALALIVFNATQLDFQNLLEGNSLVGIISIVASLCAVCMLLILITAKNIDKKKRN